MSASWHRARASVSPRADFAGAGATVTAPVVGFGLPRCPLQCGAAHPDGAGRPHLRTDNNIAQRWGALDAQSPSPVVSPYNEQRRFAPPNGRFHIARGSLAHLSDRRPRGLSRRVRLLRRSRYGQDWRPRAGSAAALWGGLSRLPERSRAKLNPTLGELSAGLGAPRPTVFGAQMGWTPCSRRPC